MYGRILNENERIIRSGTVGYRAPDGTPLPSEPLYQVVSADVADPACVVELKENERLILAGVEGNNMKNARERFDALKAGKNPPSKVDGIPFYIIAGAENVNPKTGMTWEGDKAIDGLTEFVYEEFVRQDRIVKALERQGLNNP